MDQPYKSLTLELEDAYFIDHSIYSFIMPLVTLHLNYQVSLGTRNACAVEKIWNTHTHTRIFLTERERETERNPRHQRKKEKKKESCLLLLLLRPLAPSDRVNITNHFLSSFPLSLSLSSILPSADRNANSHRLARASSSRRDYSLLLSIHLSAPLRFR